MLDDGSTTVVPVWRAKNLIASADEPRAALLSGDIAGRVLDAASELVFLGTVDGRGCFAADLSETDDAETALGLRESGRFTDLIGPGSAMSALDFELAAYARGMLHWHRHHRFCGSCGNATRPIEGGHARLCETCDRKHFPRTDPAVMVLVTDGDRCLLARQPGFPSGMYSAIAGFVEPGETVEQAVHRETKEEVGLDVSDLRFFRTQPWPFPSSLMLAYTVVWRAGEVTLVDDELEEARWFSRSELRAPEGFFYPPPVSLAHHLIGAFVRGDD